MLGITSFAFFLLAVFLLNVTPGPDTAYIVGRSVAQGRGAGVVSALGISAGCIVHTLACAFGLTDSRGIGIGDGVHGCQNRRRDLSDLSRRAADLRETRGYGRTTTEHRAEIAASAFHARLRHERAESESRALLRVVLPAIRLRRQPAQDARVSHARPRVYHDEHGVEHFVAWIAGSVTARFSGNPGVKKWLDRGVGTAFVGFGIKLATSHR